jgi:hypothetical protein
VIHISLGEMKTGSNKKTRSPASGPGRGRVQEAQAPTLVNVPVVSALIAVNALKATTTPSSARPPSSSNRSRTPQSAMSGMGMGVGGMGMGMGGMMDFLLSPRRDANNNDKDDVNTFTPQLNTTRTTDVPSTRHNNHYYLEDIRRDLGEHVKEAWGRTNINNNNNNQPQLDNVPMKTRCTTFGGGFRSPRERDSTAKSAPASTDIYGALRSTTRFRSPQKTGKVSNNNTTTNTTTPGGLGSSGQTPLKRRIINQNDFDYDSILAYSPPTSSSVEVFESENDTVIVYAPVRYPKESVVPPTSVVNVNAAGLINKQSEAGSGGPRSLWKAGELDVQRVREPRSRPSTAPTVAPEPPSPPRPESIEATGEEVENKLIQPTSEPSFKHAPSLDDSFDDDESIDCSDTAVIKQYLISIPRCSDGSTGLDSTLDTSSQWPQLSPEKVRNEDLSRNERKSINQPRSEHRKETIMPATTASSVVPHANTSRPATGQRSRPHSSGKIVACREEILSIPHVNAPSIRPPSSVRHSYRRAPAGARVVKQVKSTSASINNNLSANMKSLLRCDGDDGTATQDEASSITGKDMEIILLNKDVLSSRIPCGYYGKSEEEHHIMLKRREQLVIPYTVIIPGLQAESAKMSPRTRSDHYILGTSASNGNNKAGGGFNLTPREEGDGRSESPAHVNIKVPVSVSGAAASKAKIERNKVVKSTNSSTSTVQRAGMSLPLPHHSVHEYFDETKSQSQILASVINEEGGPSSPNASFTAESVYSVALPQFPVRNSFNRHTTKSIRT